eukprot:Platyproteum_vivax@DN16061_c0_g1_i1.p1
MASLFRGLVRNSNSVFFARSANLKLAINFQIQNRHFQFSPIRQIRTNGLLYSQSIHLPKKPLAHTHNSTRAKITKWVQKQWQKPYAKNFFEKSLGLMAASNGSRQLTLLRKYIQKHKPDFKQLLNRDSFNHRKERAREFYKKTQVSGQKAVHGVIGLWKQYGWIGVGTYVTVYVGTVFGLFYLVSMGIFTADDAKKVVEYWHLQNHINLNSLSGVDSAWGRFLVAWVLTKVCEPIRAVVSIGLTPLVAKLIRKPAVIASLNQTKAKMMAAGRRSVKRFKIK